MHIKIKVIIVNSVLLTLKDVNYIIVTENEIVYSFTFWRVIYDEKAFKYNNVRIAHNAVCNFERICTK